MSFKTFISHKREDAVGATMLKMTLEAKGIETYVDIFDSDSCGGPELGDRLHKKLGECSGLVAVISAATSGSWWVPWEIGSLQSGACLWQRTVATDQAYPAISRGGRI